MFTYCILICKVFVGIYIIVLSSRQYYFCLAGAVRESKKTGSFLFEAIASKN